MNDEIMIIPYEMRYNLTLKLAFFGIFGNLSSNKSCNVYRTVGPWLNSLNDEEVCILYDTLKRNLDLIENLENKSKLLEYLSQSQMEDIGL